MRLVPRRRDAPQIGLTPLIDILFIVLTFLVLTTTFRDASAIRLALPAARSSAPIARDVPGRIIVEIDAEGAFSLDGQAVDLRSLAVGLANRQDGSDRHVLLAADERADYGRVVAALDAAREAGFQRIDIETVDFPAASEP